MEGLVGKYSPCYNSFINKLDIMKNINFQLGVLFLEEEEHVVAYSPALDLYTQGEDLGEAKRMFEDAVNLFFKEITESGTYYEVLLDLGWKVSKARPKELVPPHIIGPYQQKFQVSLGK